MPRPGSAGVARSNRSATTSTWDCSIEPPLVSHWRVFDEHEHPFSGVAAGRLHQARIAGDGELLPGPDADFREILPGVSAPGRFGGPERGARQRELRGQQLDEARAALVRSRGRPLIRAHADGAKDNREKENDPLACPSRPALRDASEAVDQGHSRPPRKEYQVELHSSLRRPGGSLRVMGAH